MICTLDFGGPKADRSMVKSVVALAFDAGIPPSVCDLATEYLKNEESERCFYPYYGKDVVVDRKLGMPMHYVYVTGSPKTRTLLGYVEFYGVVRRVVCLSRGYAGREFSRLDAIDPTTGEEQDAKIELDEFTMRAAQAQTHDLIIAGTAEAINCVMDAGQAEARNRELERVIKEGWDEWLSYTGKEEGDEMTEECQSPGSIGQSSPGSMSHPVGL